MKRRTFVLCVAGAAISDARALDAPYPNRPIRLILTAPPGSSIDLLGRLIADKLRQPLGQILIADNRGAAGGVLGTELIAKAEADGYTIGLSFTGPLVLAPLLTRTSPYQPGDFAPIICVGTAPNILAINAALPPRNLKEFFAYARAQPGRLNYASLGNGSSSHLAMEMLKTRAGLFMVHIPYNGAPAAVQAAAAGEVQLIMSNPTSLLPVIKSGKLRALAVTSATRWADLPALPTIAESGFPNFEAVAWNGFIAPAATPRPIVERLNREIANVLQDADLSARIRAAGWNIVSGSPQQFATYWRAERERWAPVVKASGATID